MPTLVINEPEAGTVRTLFRLYLERETVRRLKEEADRRGLVTKRRPQATGEITGGESFTRGHLYQLLSNPIYAGDVRHKEATYPGQHPAIFDQKGFGGVIADRHPRRDAQPGAVEDIIGDLHAARLLAIKAGAPPQIDQPLAEALRLVEPAGAGWRELQAVQPQLVDRRGPRIDQLGQRPRRGNRIIDRR